MNDPHLIDVASPIKYKSRYRNEISKNKYSTVYTPEYWSVAVQVCRYHLTYDNDYVITSSQGAQWLSGRVLVSGPKGRRFEPHRRHWVVSLSKNINPSLVLVQPRKNRPFITERLLMGRKESNQTNKQIVSSSVYRRQGKYPCVTLLFQSYNYQHSYVQSVYVLQSKCICFETLLLSHTAR